jgi:ATP-dependent RNA helicase DeaD
MATNDFSHLLIPQQLMRVIEERKYEQPTSIQNKAIPSILEGKNVIVQSATGSGKTLCFASQIVNVVEPGYGVQALVLAPTKELAKQLHKELEDLSKYKTLKVVSTFGGAAYKEHQEEIYGADVIIGTTGRISDFVEKGTFELGRIKSVIIDEADELFLSSQFMTELEFILKQCPKVSQKIVCSATIPKEATELIKHYIKEPKRIVADSYVNPKKLKQMIYQVEQDKKYSLLVHFLKYEQMGLSIVFCNRQDTAEWLSKNLKSVLDLDVKLLHGETTPGKRTKILNDFREQKFDLLVTTDIAARGLDVEHISHVFNYTIPKNPDKYIHRIGRTARAGAQGKVFNFVSPADTPSFIEILKEHDIFPIFRDLPQFEQVEIKKEYTTKKNRR